MNANCCKILLHPQWGSAGEFPVIFLHEEQLSSFIILLRKRYYITLSCGKCYHSSSTLDQCQCCHFSSYILSSHILLLVYPATIFAKAPSDEVTTIIMRLKQGNLTLISSEPNRNFTLTLTFISMYSYYTR